MASKPTSGYKNMFLHSDLGRYIMSHSLRLTAEQEGLRQRTMKHCRARMLASADQLQLCANICKMIGAKKTLDIGVYTGYSALCVAQALPEDGQVVACDVSEEFTSIGKPFWEQAGVTNKIDLRIAPAIETLRKLLDDGQAGTFDFAFIDADKPNYDNYYEMVLKLLRKGGFLALDNVFWSETVLDPNNTDADTVALRELNDKVYRDERVCMSMLNMGDGLTLVFKVQDLLCHA